MSPLVNDTDHILDEDELIDWSTDAPADPIPAEIPAKVMNTATGAAGIARTAVFEMAGTVGPCRLVDHAPLSWQYVETVTLVPEFPLGPVSSAQVAQAITQLCEVAKLSGVNAFKRGGLPSDRFREAGPQAFAACAIDEREGVAVRVEAIPYMGLVQLVISYVGGEERASVPAHVSIAPPLRERAAAVKPGWVFPGHRAPQPVACHA